MAFVVRSVLFGSLVAGAAVLAAAARGAFPRNAALTADPDSGRTVHLAGRDHGPDRQARAGSVCGGFSAEGRYENVPVAWSFRLCEVARHAYEVQLRFRNVSAHPRRTVRFAYRVWPEPPGRCDGPGPDRPALLEDEKELSPGEVDEWPYAVGVLPRRAYRGEIWSCAALKG